MLEASTRQAQVHVTLSMDLVNLVDAVEIDRTGPNLSEPASVVQLIGSLAQRMRAQAR